MPLLAFASKDAKGWWDILEVNIRGTYNFIQCECPMPIIVHNIYNLYLPVFRSLNC